MNTRKTLENIERIVSTYEHAPFLSELEYKIIRDAIDKDEDLFNKKKKQKKTRK